MRAAATVRRVDGERMEKVWIEKGRRRRQGFQTSECVKKMGVIGARSVWGEEKCPATE